MLWAADYHQRLDPFAGKFLGSSILSTFIAALPVLVLFWLLVPRRWLAPKAGAGAVVVAFLLAVTVYAMPIDKAAMSFVHGASFGLLPVGWTIFNAMLLYNITVQTGQFDIIRRSIAGLSGDARIQAIIIGFSFGAFLEGAAGGGTPVAICGAMMVGLGFSPFQAAVLCLIANTSPVAYGGLGTPIITLNVATNLDGGTLSVMAGHQLPFLSLIVPLYMVKCMCTWRQTLQVWPALLVAGGSFAGFQFLFATLHYYGGPELWPMTDIGGGIFSLVVTAIFLQFWKPKSEFRFDKANRERERPDETTPVADAPGSPSKSADEAHDAEVAAAKALAAPTSPSEVHPPLTVRSVSLAWAPFALMSVLLLLTGIVRQKEGKGPVQVGSIQTNYLVKLPWLHGETHRDPKLHTVRDDEAAVLALSSSDPILTAVNVTVAERLSAKAEKAEFNFAWLTAPGTAVFVAALLSMLMLRMNGSQIKAVLHRTVIQMKIPIPTIALMLGLSSITKYAGMDATLGYAFANTGFVYPFFAAMLGWLGVFLTGTDAGSNALFGSLQKITATQIHKAGAFAASGLSLDQAQVLICTANSTGGVMGKMIDAQSIVVSTAATDQIGREADIFKAVVWHSIVLAVVVGLLTLLQAYVAPFTAMVPKAGP
jgi:lactate permease